ncbi:hypothetical protein BDA96_07G026800 [Sorghum bicolor]|uniref:Uncharacterized protein n=2 Tax=Sorghum bicolor TaxID=4558 RepID=A0A921QI16_SORBI|nr:hypothetical protein BDA96_07G026800 [Sorghum bicolor]OQU79820.1 hypothetical protein SORBI_3007G025350 [Sorghum bicolor]
MNAVARFAWKSAVGRPLNLTNHDDGADVLGRGAGGRRSWALGRAVRDDGSRQPAAAWWSVLPVGGGHIRRECVEHSIFHSPWGS